MTEKTNQVLSTSARDAFEAVLTAVRSDALDVTFPEGFKTPNELIPAHAGAPLLLGFSGGIDSSVLLFFTYCYATARKIPLRLVHLHHGIRGEEADRDAAFAEEIAALYGLPLSLVHRNVPAIAAEGGESLETAARRVRYEVFRDTMREHGATVLLTAHNADDNLETVLFHLLRGSGLSGLCGIPPVRTLEYGTVIRPLLETSRSAIEAAAEHYHVPFVTDSTNADVTYTRNRLRREIIPALRTVTPSPEKAVSRLTATLRRDKDYLDTRATELLSRADTGKGLDRTVLLSAEDPILLRTLLRYWQSAVPHLDSYESLHLEALLDFVRNGRNGTHLSLHAATASLEQGLLRIRADACDTNAETADFTTLLTSGETVIPALGITLFLCTKEEADAYRAAHACESVAENGINIYNSSTQIAFSFDTIEGRVQKLPLYARPRRPGDRILMRGMHRSLRTLYNEAHLPKETRMCLPVITLGDEILWIPTVGVRDGVYREPPEGFHGMVLILSEEKQTVCD